MNIIDINKESLIKLLSNKDNNCGMGSYGILINYDNSSLIKIYYKDIFNTYITLNEKDLDKEITTLLEVEKTMKSLDYNFKNKLDILKERYNALKKTKSNNLIKGIVTYRNYPIGIILENYKEYFNLNLVFPKLNKKNQIRVLSEIKELLFDLFANGIYPTDIKEDNILINPINLNIKLIDLDGIQTRVETKEYIQEFPYIKNNCINSFEYMCNRLYNIKNKV